MAKVIVVYESKYGNTKRAAETIIKAMKQKGVETVLAELKEVDLNRISDYDAFLVGSPNHFGGPTRGIRRFIDDLGKLGLKGKQAAVFDTYIEKDYEKAVKKMEKLISEKAPDLKIATPGLSIKLEGMKGPILDEELSKCEEFGERVAEQI